MYFRRKLVLALLEKMGPLTKTECQKYIFLLSHCFSERHYDFFPYRFGPYSATLAEDLDYLESKGYLRAKDTGRLELIKGGFARTLSASSTTALSLLHEQYGLLRGDSLIREVYKLFPYYASRSEISGRIVPVKSEPNSTIEITEAMPNELQLFTIGYEGRSIDKYLDLLIQNRIVLLIDVRKNPLSMKYGFSKQRLKSFVEMVGINYLHLPDLGIESSLRQNLNTLEDYERLFALYEHEILPNKSEAIQTVEQEVEKNKRVALTCFEASHVMCHRSVVARTVASASRYSLTPIHL